jgi:hypothetical protein
MSTVTAIARAKLDHMVGSRVNNLRAAATRIIETAQPTALIDTLRHALDQVPEQQIDWDHVNDLRDAQAHCEAMAHYPELVAAADDVVKQATVDTTSIVGIRRINWDRLIAVLTKVHT